MDKEFELKPHNSQKSYYGKARVIQEREISTLISYTTKVAQYDSYLDKMQVFGWYSNTTAKHINSFLNYFGFKTCCKKELENYGNK